MFARKTRLVLRFGVLVIGVLIFSAAEGEQPPLAQLGEESNAQESLEVRYARAHLKLANLDLQRVLGGQKQHPDLLPTSVAEEFKRHVAIDEEQLQQALKGPDGDVHEIYVRSATVAVELAEADLKRKQKTYRKLPDKITAAELQRAEAVLEVARLHLEMTRARTTALPSMMYLQWQIEVLRNQVLELQLQVQKLEQVPG